MGSVSTAKIMSSKRRKIVVVPWRDVQEFKYIYDHLYQEDPERQRSAVDRLKSWKARCAKLPVAIECTRDFVEVQLERTDGDDENFKKVCTLAVIRLVNHFTEELQIYGKGKAVHHLAEKIDLPKWIVDIRHAGTHGHMPNKSILEGALTFCLKWLREKFWEPHVRRMEEGSDRQGELDVQKREKINQLVSRYMEIMGTTTAQGQNGIVQFKLEEVLGPLHKLIQCTASRNYLADLLSHDGYLVPTLEQETALGIETENADKIDDLPRPVLDLWSPLLHHFHALDFGPCVVQSIMDQLSKISGRSDRAADTPVTRYLLGWAKHLIKQDTDVRSCGDSETGSPPRKRCKKGAWDSTVKRCIKNPNRHSLELLPNLLLMAEEPSISAENQQKILQAATLITQGPNGLPQPPNGIPTPAEMEKMLERKKKKMTEGGTKAKTEMMENKKNLGTIKWSRIPLGVLPWQPHDADLFQLTPPTTSKRKRKLSSEDALD